MTFRFTYLINTKENCYFENNLFIILTKFFINISGATCLTDNLALIKPPSFLTTTATAGDEKLSIISILIIFIFKTDELWFNLIVHFDFPQMLHRSNYSEWILRFLRLCSNDSGTFTLKSLLNVFIGGCPMIKSLNLPIPIRPANLRSFL